MASLATTDAVIDALGGNGPTGTIVGATPKAVSNWRASARGKFPPETFVAINDALKRIGRKADPSLWSMIQSGGGAPRKRRATVSPASEMEPGASSLPGAVSPNTDRAA